MLLPHLHLNGRCDEAITFYEQAFQTKVDVIYYESEQETKKIVAHAEMHIRGQRVMLNDRSSKSESGIESVLQLIVIFADEKELRDTYESMSSDSITIDPLQATYYSPCVVHFLDKFGVPWGFMVSE